MAIRFIENAWKTTFGTTFPGTERFYLGFRQKEFPPNTASDDTYTLITSTDNQPGSHNLTGGHIETLYTMPSSLTLEVRVYPNFAYSTATDQPICGWYDDADSYLSLYYNATDDKFRVEFMDGTTLQYLESQQFDDGSVFTNISQWLTFTFTIDLSAGTGGLWVNRTQQESAWSGALDSNTTVQNVFRIRKDSSATGDYKINYIRMFDSKTVTDNDVQNAFKDIKNEEIFWYLNGEGVGRDRCNITRFVSSFHKEEKFAEPMTAGEVANIMQISIYSRQGEFADDQYAAFDPTNDQFNGTSAQKYLRQNSKFYCESWYGTNFDSIFVGRVNNSLYQRQTPLNGVSMVTIKCEDMIAEMANRIKKNGQAYQDKYLASSTEADSLVHLHAKDATNRKIFNFLGNSGFGSTAPADSWTATTGAVISRSTDYAIDGSYSLKTVYGSSGDVSQTITFTNKKKINKDETWNVSLFARSTAPASIIIKLGEYSTAATTDIANTDTTGTLAGGEGWKRFNVAHQLSSTTADRLKVIIRNADTSANTIYYDAVQLIQDNIISNFLVNSTAAGSSGVFDADDAIEGEYQRIGFDVEQVAIQHPWVRIEAGENIWKHLKDINNAIGGYKFGVDQAGTFSVRAHLAGATDPSPIETVTSAVDITAAIGAGSINKIVVKGIKIVERSHPQVMWTGSAAGMFTTGHGDYLNLAVPNGETFPDSTTYPRYIANYGIV